MLATAKLWRIMIPGIQNAGAFPPFTIFENNSRFTLSRQFHKL
jgi:hypothetical protein